MAVLPYSSGRLPTFPVVCSSASLLQIILCPQARLEIEITAPEWKKGHLHLRLSHRISFSLLMLDSYLQPAFTADVQLGIWLSCCTLWVLYSLPTRNAITQGGVYVLQCFDYIRFPFKQFLLKTKPSLQWERRTRNWYSYFLGLDKGRGQITNRVVVAWARKRHVIIFLVASLLGVGMLGVIHRENASWRWVMLYSSPETVL